MVYDAIYCPFFISQSHFLQKSAFFYFSMVWIFFICLFRFFFLRLETYAKQVFTIRLDQEESKFVMWKPNEVNFMEKVEFWEQNRSDFFSKSRAVNRKLGSSWNFYCKLDFCSSFKMLTHKNSIKSSVKWVKRSKIVILLQSRKVLNIKFVSYNRYFLRYKRFWIIKFMIITWLVYQLQLQYLL